jgi:hypothetical protein
MKVLSSVAIAAVLVLLGSTPGLAIEASQLKDTIKLEVLSVGLQPGMPPGFFICSEGHLHIRASVKNTGSVPLDGIKVAGKVFDASGEMLGTATAVAKPEKVAPNGMSEVNLEFLKVTGPKIEQVKNHEVTVVEAHLGTTIMRAP